MGLLSKGAVSKFSKELSGLLCDEARHSNLDPVVTQLDLNLVGIAAKQKVATISEEGQRLVYKVICKST